MTNDKVRQVVRKYQEQLAERNARPVRSVNASFKEMVRAWGEMRPETSVNLLDHCAHACVEILKFVDEGRREKAFRWLGWLQCALWVAGIIPTIEDGARDNMPDAPTQTYETLVDEVKRLMDEGKIPREMTREARIDWVLGNLNASTNHKTTREIVEAAADRVDAERLERANEKI